MLHAVKGKKYFDFVFQTLSTYNAAKHILSIFVAIIIDVFLSVAMNIDVFETL